jgi:hypothetical protein
MLKMRINVMELGRFTAAHEKCPETPEDLLDYPPRQEGTQCKEWNLMEP